MSTLLRACRAELRAIRADRGALVVLGLAALIYAFFYPLPYVGQVVRDVPVVVVDEDGTAMSRRLIRMVDAAEQVRVAEVVPEIRQAEARVHAGRAHGVLAIPAGFERSLARGERVVVGAYGDASYFLVYSQVATGLAQATGTLSGGIEVRRLQGAGLPEAAAVQRRDPLPLQVRPLFNPTGGYGTYVVPAVLVIILQQTLMVGIGMLRGGEREHGEGAAAADEPGAAAPLRTLLGRTLAYVTIYLAHIAVYLTLVYRVWGFSHTAAPAAVMLFLLPFLLATVFLGMAIASLFRERETAIQAMLFTSLPAVFVSGFSWPVEAMPRWLAALARLLPSTEAIHGFLRLNQMGASFAQVQASWAALWALAGAYALLAGYLALSRRPAPGPAPRLPAGPTGAAARRPARRPRS